MDDTIWPELDYRGWRDTLQTVQLWTQIVGKVRLALTPWLNHSWHVPLYVTARGLGTSAMPNGNELVEIDFDFIDHRLSIRSSTGPERGFALIPMSVADFYRMLMDELAMVGVNVTIDDRPNEVSDPVAFPLDTVHRSYDAAAIHRFWRALVQADRLLKLFRTSFLGKASPVHFFWGSFDLAATRFSGAGAPRHPGGIPNLPDDVTREAYSNQESSAGFWPGNDMYPHAAFYSYAWPSPPGFDAAKVAPAGAVFDATLGEWLLPWDAVRAAPDPDAAVLAFLQSTYAAAADLGGWDRAGLECSTGQPGVVRPV